jgi:hypothetical protein
MVDAWHRMNVAWYDTTKLYLRLVVNAWEVSVIPERFDRADLLR